MDAFFSKPTFNCIGDPYHDPPLDPYKHGASKGVRQFLTSPAKKGQTANAIGYGPLEYKAMYLPGKEPFQESFKYQASRRMEGRKKFIAPNGFVYSNPMKKSSAPGDTNGTFAGVIENMPESSFAQGARSKLDLDSIPRRNIQTSPGKRGGFGVAGTLIGGNPEYVGSEYSAYEDMVRAGHAKHRVACGERRPFTSTAKCVEFFDSNEHCAASKIYSLDGCTLPAGNLDDAAGRRMEDMTVNVFRPSSPAKQGFNGTLSPFPTALHEPFDEKVIRRATLPVRRQPVSDGFKECSAAIKERKPFRPSHGPKAAPTRPLCTVGLRP